MSQQQPPTNRNRYLPTRENFILRMKKLLYDLAGQANTGAGQSNQADTPPNGQKPPTKRP
jgi:hypothetical protein